MTYCNENDLLVGDVATTPGRGLRFINIATDEINESLGYDYELPVPSNIPEHVKLTLKRCCVLIASGRYLLAQAVGGEDVTTHAYGQSLLNEGHAILQSIRSGALDLIGMVPLATGGGTEGNAPRIIQGDQYSAVDSFYGRTGALSDFWGPGVR